MRDRHEDAEVIRRVLAGDRQAYAVLVRKYHPQVLQLCSSMLRDPAEAEDAAQEAFLKAYRSLKDFQGSASFSTWLYRIASNRCLDLLRGRARRKTDSWDGLVESEGEGLGRLLGSSPEPLPALEAADLARRVLELLPEDYRLILTLRETQGLSYEEIAEAMDCSLDSVKARLRRAREALEEKLRHFWGPGNV